MKKKSLVLDKYLIKRPLFYSFIRPEEAELFAKFAAFKNPALDFGCGDGFFAKMAFGGQVFDTGIDVDKNIEREALLSKKYKTVVVYKGEKIPFSNNKFSSIFSNCVLEHIPMVDQTLRELNRVLKRKGYFYLTVVNSNWESNLLGGKIFGEIYLRWLKKTQKHYNLLSELEWKRIFKRNNFEIIKTIAYHSSKQQIWNEVFHFLSIPDLMYKRFFGKWTVFNNWPFSIIARKIILNVNREKGKDCSCNFFVLRKC